MSRRITSSGFTLIELSIVLVIIGLIVGSVLVGKDLIQAATRRAIISEMEKFNTAVFTFRTKYDCIPGDCATAESIWGTKPGGCLDQTQASSPGTCNGNGNGIIDSGYFTGVSTQEEYTFWQQLQLAGLTNATCSNGVGYQGMCTGISHSAPTTDSVPGTNVPYSNYAQGAAYDVMYQNTNLSGYAFFVPNANVFTLGGNNCCGRWFTGAAFSPTDAYAIDKKIDDGLPGSGRVFTWISDATNYSPGCATTDSASTAVYSVNDPTKTNRIICNMFFIAGF